MASLIHLFSYTHLPLDQQPHLSLSSRSVRRGLNTIEAIMDETIGSYYNDCNCYSVVIDETKDLGQTVMGVYGRFALSNGRFVQPKITVRDYNEQGDAESIVKWLKDVLKEKGLELDKFVGITTDGANIMQGTIKGVTKKIVDEVKELKDGRKLLLVCNKFYCIAHRVNLSIAAVVKCDKVQNIFGFVKWFTQSSIVSQWNQFRDKRQLKCIPVPSQIRWSYHSDIVSFIRKNYDNINEWMNNNDSIMTSYINYMKNTIKLDMSKDINCIINTDFHAVLVAIDELLLHCKFLTDNLQQFDGFIPEKYNMVLNHIQWLYSYISELGNNRKRKRRHYLTDYFKEAVKSNSFTSLNGDIKQAFVKHLRVLQRRFLNFDGRRYTNSISNITSYDKFIDKLYKVNNNNILFQLSVLSIKYEDRNRHVPATFNKRLVSQYRKLFRASRGNPYCQDKHICEAIEILEMTKTLELLYVNMNALYSIPPTSCCVESVFSTKKNIQRPNLKNQTRENLITSHNQVRTNERNTFAFQHRVKSPPI